MPRKASLAQKPDGQAYEFPGRTGAERAAARLAAKVRANAEFYRNTPAPPISRQVQRFNARKGR
ncbi:hypothetical protein ACO2Q0_02770 [Phenylobacterium sp. VNQ135]|uniref:hypothetical protein n=1 Tax=Phenylobacterium sp. VNQ135 TaxID=3400922 RepID=UPI003C0C2BA8